jgi:pimeloyl-ACP methyl ester carboxylesterase
VKKLTIAVTITAVVAALSTGVTVVASANPAAPQRAAVAEAHLAWGNCQDPELAAFNAQCALLSVPLDYAHPNGKHIKIAVSRVLHTSSDAAYQGVILVNPGGPGGAGLSLATLGQDVPQHAGDDYDWIGFDPRGVGASRPAMRCQPNYFHANRPDYRPRTQQLVDTWLARSKHYADSCAKKYPRLIHHMTTAEVARDMDQIRKALGVSKISFFGFSYGTYLGQVYATLFPTHVRRMVLDSNVDPHRVWYHANLDQDRAFNRNIKIWFRWVAKYHRHYGLGSSESAVETKWYDVLNKLAQHPAGGELGPDEWSDTFLYAGYYRFTWLELGEAFAGYVHHHRWRAVMSLYRAFNGPGDDNGFAVYSAVQCTDAPWPKSWSTWKADNTRISAKAPFLTWGNAWFNAPCLYWHAGARKAVDITGVGIHSALLIDETLDAATPFHGSLVVRKLFPHSSLIAEPGGATHADSLSGDRCVDNAIASYLATGKRPPRQRWNGPDYLCRPLPDPSPPSGSAAHTVRPQFDLQRMSPLLRAALRG